MWRHGYARCSWDAAVGIIDGLGIGCSHLCKGIEAHSLEHLVTTLIKVCLRLATSRRNKVAQTSTALYDGLSYQSLTHRRDTEVTNAGTTSTLSEDSDIIRVASKLGDVVLNPLQGCNLIEQAIVTRNVIGIFCRQFRMVQETENA